HDAVVGAGTGVEAAPRRQTGPAVAEGGFSDSRNQRAGLLLVRWPAVDTRPGSAGTGQRFTLQPQPGGLHPRGQRHAVRRRIPGNGCVRLSWRKSVLTFLSSGDQATKLIR